MAEQTLEIRVNFKAGDAESGLTRLKGLIESVDRASQGRGFTQLSGVADSMTQLGLAAKNIKDIGPYFEQVAKSAEGLFKTFQSFDPKSYASRVAALSGSLRTVGDAMRSFVDGASGMSSKVSENVKNASESVGKMGSSAKTSARSVSLSFSDVGNNMKKVVSLGYQVAKLPFKMILAPIRGIGRGLSNMTGHFSKFLSGIGRIALYRAIRTGIKIVTTAVREGVNNLYIWAGMVGNSFKPTMDSLATSFLYLKNSIGAMVSPILDAVAPAFEYLTNKIVDVLNVFNQVIATITGASTWRKALRAPASYADNISGLGHDAEDANDAVKELKRTILGFDEINRLDDKTKTITPKKNGKDATGYYAKDGALSFTELPIGQKALDIAQMLKGAWAKGDFTSIGTMIGEKIGAALQSVPWDTKIKPTVQKLATSFGTLLNGMFDYTGSGGKAMWDGIAYTIYNALNTAVLGYVTFFDTVHWEGIGQGVGAALKRVMDNLDWNMIARALAAFPNAVIDAVTGFSKRFTTQDFYNAGQNIGRTISNALVLINWTGLFGNALNIATGVLAALNGALEDFDWKGVKEAILNGIKKIPKDTWSNLGTEIGRAIFNIANFAAHLIDTMVSVIENGGWTGVANTLADWLGNHIGVVSIALTIAFGLPLLKSLPAAFATTVMNGLKAKRIPGTGTPLGQWAQNLSLAAGITLAVNTFGSIWGHDFKKSSIKDNLITTLKSGIKGALAGALIGWSIGGVHGALIGATIGLAITLAVIGLKWDPFSEKTRAEISKGLQDNVNREIADAAANLDALDLNKQNQLETYYQNRTVGAGNTGSKVTTGILSVSLDPKAAPNAWQQLVQAWAKITKTNKVARFLTEGVVNKANDWWSSVKTFWAQAINGKTAKRFTIEGIVNQAQNWWGQVTNFWRSYISGKNAARFTTEGVTNQATTWWGQVTNFWRSYISGKNAARFTTEGVQNHATTWWEQVASFWASIVRFSTGSPFEIAGVVNDAWHWWNQTQNYWDQATYWSNLYANVEIGNPWNAFVSAFNSMQNYFNQHTLTAFVKTATQTATDVSKSYQKKAQGGIYKGGQWHDITKYAAGALGVQSGEMFIAREAGPELVGSIGGNTAVMNNDQIVSSVAAGVAQAVASVMGGSGGSPIEVTVKVDSETLYRTVRKGERRASGRYGTTVAIG